VADVPVFCRLLEATGRRQGFRTEPESYISRMHQILAPRALLRLFISEYEGEPVSGALVICFGDTVVYKRGAWSGRYREHRPNEVMHWEVIRWARVQGYRCYDFEEIEPAYAEAVLTGSPIPDGPNRGLDSFKLGFGARVVHLPALYASVDNPLVDRAFRIVFPKLSDHPFVRRAINGMRMQRTRPRAGMLRQPVQSVPAGCIPTSPGPLERTHGERVII
jgi:lipid II:glycine glycyltransferase (peptidoglycan interpeptide bridge formation enzyme)